MIIVYVWNSSGSGGSGPASGWGHASLSVTGGEGADVYISWWPAGGTESSDPNSTGVTQDLTPIVYCKAAFPNRSFSEDCTGEGGNPDQTFNIPGLSQGNNGLSETNIKSWWNGFRTSGKAAWCDKTFNCSTCVANALVYGGAATYSDYFGNPVLYWAPANVAEFCQLILAGMANADPNISPNPTGNGDDSTEN
jgi:hypothetical protein